LYYLCKLARQYVKVVLSGDGGDEIFAGYNVYNYALTLEKINNRIGWVIGSAPIGFLVNSINLPVNNWLGNVVRRMRKVHRLVNLQPSLRIPFMGDLRSYRGEWLMNFDPTTPEMPEYVDAFEHAQKETKDWLWPYLYADIKTLLPDEMFTKLDRVTMANGIEGRVPLCDYRLVEFAAKIPSHLKLKKGCVKSILKLAMRDRLPKEIIKRKKLGFRVPLNEWFRGPLKTMAYDLLIDKSFRDSGIFNVNIVNKMLDNHVKSLGRNGNEIFELVCFELWRRNLHEKWKS
jgi:asparagine synthase (glutamine-hydrolysing)